MIEKLLEDTVVEEEEILEAEAEIEDAHKKKGSSNQEQKNRWEDWWRGVTRLKETPVTPKTTLAIKKKKKEELLLNTKKTGSIVKKRKDWRKKKKNLDGLKQLTVKEMIQNVEIRGQNPEKGRAK